MIASAVVPRHLAFFETLAALDDADPRARAVSAGLVTLRLVDRWREEGEEAVRPHCRGLLAVYDAIAEMAPGEPARASLRSIVDAMRTSPVRELAAIAPRLVAYARALDHQAQWALAADVYDTVLDGIDVIEEWDLAANAAIQLGLCERMLGRWDEAEHAYARARQIALATGGTALVIRTHIAEAKIAIERGNLPRARQILDTTIDRSSSTPHEEMHSLALHERARLDFISGAFESGIHFAYRALELAALPLARERILGDIGAAFMDLGMRDVARDALLVVSATAQELSTMWYATINLLEIAARDGARLVFEQHRRALVDERMPPLLVTQARLTEAKGFLLLGEPDRADAAAREALRLATQYSFAQITFDAEHLLEEIRTGQAERAPASIPPSPAVQDVATAMRAMRSAVLTGSR